jgi:tetratricopeptide (TPR) repeat protein
MRIGKGVPKDPAEAILWYQKALDQKYHMVYAYYAWLLATCPEAECRNGKKAVELARSAVSLSPESSTEQSILAAAYAETGQFALAVETQKRALDLLDETADEKTRNDFHARLQSYETQQPWRAGGEN